MTRWWITVFVLVVGCRVSAHFSGSDLSSPDDMAGDMADDAAQDDLAAIVDLGGVSSGPDMVLTCPGLGNTCLAGTGACAANGTVVCTAQGVSGCNATIGPADHTGAWHTAPAPNGSWDWDCDGHVEYQYPTGSQTAPPMTPTPCAAVPIGMCGPPNDQLYWPTAGTPCGNMLSEWMCMPNNANGQCMGGAQIPGPTEGCH